MLINMCLPSLKERGVAFMFKYHIVKVNLLMKQANLPNLPNVWFWAHEDILDSNSLQNNFWGNEFFSRSNKLFTCPNVDWSTSWSSRWEAVY
jgi:hypothetical protein